MYQTNRNKTGHTCDTNSLLHTLIWIIVVIKHFTLEILRDINFEPTIVRNKLVDKRIFVNSIHQQKLITQNILTTNN